MEHPKDQITDLSLTDVLRRVGLPLELPYARDISGVRCIDYCVDAFKRGCDETTAYYTSGAPFQAALKRAKDAEDLVKELRQDRDSILQSNKTLAKDNLSISAENQRLAALNADYQKRINEMEAKVNGYDQLMEFSNRQERCIKEKCEDTRKLSQQVNEQLRRIRSLEASLKQWQDSNANEYRVQVYTGDRVEEIVEERTARLKSELAKGKEQYEHLVNHVRRICKSGRHRRNQLKVAKREIAKLRAQVEGLRLAVRCAHDPLALEPVLKGTVQEIRGTEPLTFEKLRGTVKEIRELDKAHARIKLLEATLSVSQYTCEGFKNRVNYFKERLKKERSELAREHLKVIHDHEIKNQDEVTKLQGIIQRQKEYIRRTLDIKNSRIQELNGIVSALRKRLENAKRHYRLVVAQRNEAANRAGCMEDRWRKALELGSHIEADVRATLEKQHAAEVTKLHATIQQLKSDLQQAEVDYKKMRENRNDALSRLSNTEAWLTDFFE